MNNGVHVNEASAVQQSGDASGADRWVGAGGSTAADVEAAVDEAWTVAVGGRVPGLVIVFCSTAYPLADVAAAVETRAGGAPVIGCSTSGEVATDGPSESGLALWALGGDGFDVHTGVGQGSPDGLRSAAAGEPLHEGAELASPVGVTAEHVKGRCARTEQNNVTSEGDRACTGYRLSESLHAVTG